MQILTRGDFDGLVSSALLTEAENITTVTFTEARLIQNREFPVTSEDIIVNLPFHPSCGMWFDHHISEQQRGPRPTEFKGKYGLAPSCARLIYNYYNLPEWEERYKTLLDETDRIDSGRMTLEDILRPQGWVRIANIVDPRTGFKPSRELFFDLMEWIKAESVEDILKRNEINDLVREFFKAQDEFKKTLQANSEMSGGVVVTDFRQVAKTPVGSRFLIYALFPAACVSVRLFSSEDREKVVIALGHSVINRSCGSDIGNLLAEYGGGGHVGAGSCEVFLEDADDTLNDIVERLNATC